MNYYIITALLNFFATGSLAVIVLFSNIKNRMNQTYALTYLSIALWALFYFFWQTSSSYSDAMLHLKLLMFAATCMPIFLFHFMLAYLNIERKHYRLLSALYLIGFIFILCIYNDLLFDTLTPKLGFPFWPNAGKVMDLYMAFFFGFIIYAMFMLYKSFMSSFGSTKTRIIYLIVGLGFAILAGSPNYFLWYNIPIPPILNPLFIVSVAIIGYAILRYRLMDIEVVIKKSFVYSILAIAIMTIFAFGVFLATQILNQFNINSWILIFLGSLIISVGFLPLYDLLTKITDRWFFQKKYEYREALKKLSSQLNQLLPLKPFLKLLVRRVSATVKLEGMSAAIFDEQAGSFTISAARGKHLTLLGQVVKNDSLLIPALENAVYILKDEASPVIREEMDKFNSALIVPSKLNGRISAVFLIGEKKSQDSFSDEDIDLFVTLSNQAAAAIENCRTYEKESIRANKAEEKVEIAEKEIERVSRLASLGTLAAGVAHEIRNPMMAISSQAELLPQKLKEKDEEFLQWFSKMIPEQIFRILEIVNKMLKFARKREEESASVDVNTLIDEVLTLLGSEIKHKGITIDRRLAAKNLITASPTDIFEAFMNIIMNAIQFTGESGTVRVSSFDQKSKVIIEISDTGKGISPANIEHIFDPFFTTRAEGTGMGLSISHRIILNHGGKIEVESTENKGTTFRIILPA